MPARRVKLNDPIREAASAFAWVLVSSDYRAGQKVQYHAVRSQSRWGEVSTVCGIRSPKLVRDGKDSTAFRVSRSCQPCLLAIMREAGLSPSKEA